MVDPNLDELAKLIIDTAYRLHRDLGPGLLESAYEQLLAAKLQKSGLSVARQVPISARFEEVELIGAFRANLIVEDRLLVEIKSATALTPACAKQVLTYLRLTGLPLGLLINFGGALLKGNVRRLILDQPLGGLAPAGRPWCEPKPTAP